MSNSRSGFSFMELLVVITIIAILVTTVGYGARHLPGKARMAKARAEIQQFKVALETYYSDNGRFPTEGQGLASLCEKPSLPPVPADYPEGGYLDSLEVPKDPWGGAYVFFVPGRNGRAYEIVSYGGDREPGGEGEDADISSLEL